jgi:hypothetical protein
MTSRRLDAAELEEIALRLRDRLSVDPCDSLELAHVAGIWLEPALGCETSMRGRVIVYDPSNRKSGVEVAQCVVRFLLRAEGFDDRDVELAVLDALADKLIVYELDQSPALAVG